MKYSGLLFAFTFSSIASAGLVDCNIKTTGVRQGVFAGESVKKGHEQEAEVLSYNFEVTSPLTPTGIPSGKRQLKPLVVEKQWGASSNQYLTAIALNELLREVRIECFKQTGDTKEQKVKSIVLNNATLTNVNDSVSTTSGNDADIQQISIIYQKITITDDSKNVFTDEIKN